MYLFAADDPTNHVKDVVLWQPEGWPPLITMHMVTIVVVTIIFVLAMMKVAKAVATGPESEGNERYITKGRFSQMIEAMVIYLRDEMLEPVLGEKHTKRYLPYLMTVFFFVLFNNLFGLLPILDIIHLTHLDQKLFKGNTPIGGTATANIMVTAALAFLSLILIQIHALRELGIIGWLKHQTGGLHEEAWYIWPVMLIVVPVELLGHLIKPVALSIRLFANMVAGHTLMAVLLGFGAVAAKAGSGTLGISAIAAISGVAAVMVTFLELFVAFLQAFIFMFLTAVFMSLLSHHDEDHEHSEEPVLEAATG